MDNNPNGTMDNLEVQEVDVASSGNLPRAIILKVTLFQLQFLSLPLMVISKLLKTIKE